jgi:hypothetical protein
MIMFGNSIRILLALLVLQAVGPCQDASGQLDPRRLVYRERGDDDQLPPVAAVKSKPKPKESKPIEEKQKASVNQEPTPVAPALVSAVYHLGFRFNILKIDQDENATPTDPDGNFRDGDCIQIEFLPNRSSYLYVIVQGSSSLWKPLLPSSDLPDESNIVKSGSTVRVPRNACFEIHDPPGTEHLFMVLSRNPEDLVELDDAVRNGRVGDQQSRPPSRTNREAPVLTVGIGAAMKPWSDLQGRDVVVRKMKKGEVLNPDEPVDSVYVANASDKPSDRLVYRVDIKHNIEHR